ncbi:MAG: 50S ribosomal protein L32 [Acidobacteriota bacterium]|jgi:large subunit ribosomal protein L32|nr:50S ribosomal protein L32 [Thermoanaerobaculia bacterium]MDL2716901.1 50S ribosomal protein L32 [Acidobacteriota bacterium]
MPNPKHRHSKTRRDLRRAHDFLKPKQTSKCTNCGTEKLPHRVCPSCGHYKGREVMSGAEKA